MKDLPPNLFFDGQGDLDAFERKFNAFVKNERYSSEGRFFCLKMMLGGSASEYIDYLASKGKVATDVDAFLALQDQFKNEISPHEALVNLRSARQNSNESYEDFELRIIRMAKQAYPSQDNFEQIQTEVAMSFMTGLNDLNARGYLAGNIREATMKEVKRVLGSYTFMKNMSKIRKGRNSNSYDDTSDDEELDSTRKIASRTENRNTSLSNVSYEIKQINDTQIERNPTRIDKLEIRV